MRQKSREFIKSSRNNQSDAQTTMIDLLQQILNETKKNNQIL
jgi:hypothetical protein